MWTNKKLVDEDCEYVNLIETAAQEEFDKNCFFFFNPFETLLINSIDPNEL